MKTTGALLGTMSGSIGGATASRNRGGQYFRQRVVPTNPRTIRQQVQRAFFASLVQAWTTSLTTDQVIAWKTYADNTPRTNSLGAELILTGQQMYIASNTARLQAGLSRVDDSPVIFNTGESVTGIQEGTSGTPNVLDIVSGNLNNEILIDGETSGGANVLVYIGAPINPTVNYFKGPYQFATSIPILADETSVGFTTDVTLLQMEQPLAIGQIRPIRMVVVYDDGRASEAFETKAEVTNSVP